MLESQRGDHRICDFLSQGFRKAKLGSWPVQCLPHAFLAQDSSHRVLQGIVMSYVILEVRQP